MTVMSIGRGEGGGGGGNVAWSWLPALHVSQQQVQIT